MIEIALEKIKKGKNLSRGEMEGVFDEIMSGKIETGEIADFLLKLKEKKETVEEITGAALIMRKFATKVNVQSKFLLDTCGTGGDSRDTFNISTLSAFVASGAGARVAKHGNKAVSSKCGSADLLQALGVNINATKETMERSIDEIGIGFLFAPLFHLAMKYAMPARKMIKSRSIFNILGPLTNPAGAKFQLLGVYEEDLVPALAKVLRNLGSERAMVVHGTDGLDEISTTRETVVGELLDGNIKTFIMKPEDFGIQRATMDDLKGGDIALNREIGMKILRGEKSKKRDIVIFNAAACIYVSGIADTVKSGIKKAEESIDSGRALEKLEKLIKITNGEKN